MERDLKLYLHDHRVVTEANQANEGERKPLICTHHKISRNSKEFFMRDLLRLSEKSFNQECLTAPIQGYDSQLLDRWSILQLHTHHFFLLVVFM